MEEAGGRGLLRLVALAVLLLVAWPAWAQPTAPEAATLNGDSAQTRKRLTEADQKLKAGQVADAIDALQRVLDDAGDDLVTQDGKQYTAARWVAHQLLASLPADALNGYQDRIDDPARKLLDAAKRTRDPAPLWQLLDRYFVSRPADEGLLLLGDLLFERGEFRAAEQVWRRLLPDGGPDLIYPNSKADPAAVRARMILAGIFQGETERAKADLAAFTENHPGAKGALAGKDGPYADVLQAYLKTPPVIPAAANRGTDWPTFGGAPDRAARVGGQPPAEWRTGRVWQHAFGGARPENPDAPFRPTTIPPFGHPVIVNGQVFVTDGARVSGFDLVTGSLSATQTVSTLATPNSPPTLTAAGGRLYVRVGTTRVRAGERVKGEPPEERSTIVCLLPRDGELKVLWRLRPPTKEGQAQAVWEGPPLVVGRRMWAAYARFEGGRVVHTVACYEPTDASVAPEQPAWAVDVCDSSPSSGSDGRVRQEVLTLAGRNVVFCSNSGAVVALDAVTGRRAWGFRYPRSRKADPSRSPDPSPAVFSGGRVFVAPADGEHVYALDPHTGQLLWQSGPTEGAQIVGVAAGKVVVAVAGPVRGLRGLSVTDGSYLAGGWEHRTGSGGGFLSYGRGYVTDDQIVWPTRENGLCFVNPKDGSTIWSPWTGLKAGFCGNVVYADGVRVVVTPTHIWGFVSDSKRFEGLKTQAQGDPIRDRFETRIAAAERALAEGDHDAARSDLLTAIRSDLPNPMRAWAAARLLSLAAKTDDVAKLPADLRGVLTADLCAEWLIPPDGIPATLATLIQRHTGHEPTQKFPLQTAGMREQKPEDSPTLSPNAVIARTLRLPLGSGPLRWVAGMATPPKRVFVVTPTELLAIPVAVGEPARHDVAANFTHAADIPDGFVAVGPSAVAVYASARAPIWVFRVPTTEPLPQQPGEFRVYSGELPPTAELSAFRLSGSWLFAQLGERHLIAFDLRCRRIAWVLGTDGEPGFRPYSFPDAARFGSEFFVSGRYLVAQLSDGRRWFVRPESGAILSLSGLDHPTARLWWTLPPCEVEPNRLVVSDGPGLVRILNLTAGRAKWTHSIEGESSLAGDPPQVLAWGGVVLMAIRRNHGVELDRFEMSEGKSAWPSGPAFLDADRVSLANADADADRVYVPVSNTLATFTLKDGKPTWETTLPHANATGGWVVKAGQKCVIAYPEAAIPGEPLPALLTRLTRSFRRNPEAWRLPAMAARVYDAWVVRSVPVLLLDPKTGKRLAEFDIPASGPFVTAWFERDVAVVATGDRVVWLR